jgi:methyl-accepting chemotaxis protein
MKNWTVGKRIVSMAFVLCLLNLIIMLFSLYGLQRVRGLGETVSEKNLPGVIQTGTMNYLPMINMVRLYRLVDTDDPAVIKSIEDATLEDTKIFYEADRIYKSIMTTAKQRADYEKLDDIHQGYLQHREQFLSKLKTDPEEAKKILTVDMVKDLNEFSSQTLMMMHESADQGEQGGHELVATTKTLTTLLIIVGVISILSGMVLAYFITVGTNKKLKEVANTLNEMAYQVGSAAGVVASSSQSLADGSSQQAASIEETSSSLEEMSSMTQKNAENSREANDLARETKSAADNGVENMRAMSDAMNAIKESSDEVSKIIKTIDEIAFQTNILALNAAVEAARAGEAGAGFAVVADEVRSLAQRSAQAARETTEKIEGSNAKTTLGVDLNTKVADALNVIVEKASEMDALVTDVATASVEQSEGITQLNSAVVNIDKVTQENTSNAEQSASAAEELHSHSLAMRDAVESLLALVGGSSDKSSGSVKSSAEIHTGKSTQAGSYHHDKDMHFLS